MVVLPIENGYSGKAQSDRREDREWDQCCWRKKKGGGGARPTQLERGELYLEKGGGGGMAWSERQVSRPDLSCRKLFMRLNKMMLQLPMMNNLCLCACNRNGV